MPRKAGKYCRYPGCGAIIARGSYCEAHQPEERKPDPRSSSARRGYGAEWRKIREGVLRTHGIPHELWPLYDVDHDPPYDRDREPDHRKYRLTPRLHAAHSKKTAREDIPRDETGKWRRKD